MGEPLFLYDGGLNVGYLRALFDYTYWARDKLLAAMQDPRQSEYAAGNGFTYGNLRGTLIHCLDGNTAGVVFCRTSRIEAYLLTDNDLAGDVIACA